MQAEAGACQELVRGKPPHFMLAPSLACPAECSYCFGPHRGPSMPADVLNATLDFMQRVADGADASKLRLTFHGGEPLLVGPDFYRRFFAGLDARFGGRRREVALQSNLWALGDEFCKLFREEAVEIGTSLDGPEAITDAQRGAGYFAKTMASVRRARAWGLNVGCIVTFTPLSVERWPEVFEFFIRERLNFSVHAAVPSLAAGSAAHALAPARYGRLLREMLDYYVDHRRDIAVSSLDQMIRAVVAGEGEVCTFRDCADMFLAIDPRGDIFTCQRFAGRPEYRLGNVADSPSLGDLQASAVAQKLASHFAAAYRACGDCPHWKSCRGGCPYNAWAKGDGEAKDPYCEAYREAFAHIQNRLCDEMAREENIEAVAEKPWNGKGHPLLRRGPLIELAKDGPHPSAVARTARRIVAAVELARGPDIPAVAARLVQMGVARTPASGEASLKALQQRLHPTAPALNNLYVHVSFRCQLRCAHCYAHADSDGDGPDMPVDAVAKLLREAKEAGFRQVVITGGEPLVHRDRAALLAAFAEARTWAAPMNLVLRTNLALPLSPEELEQVARAFDQVVVSVDGDEAAHDARRGAGSYAAALRNLESYAAIAKAAPRSGELSLAAVLRATDAAGEAGEAVHELARRLGVRRTRFRPLLPLGRAREWDEPPTSEALGAHLDPREMIEAGFQPVASCGLGQNLYVEPSGQSFPCYAYHRPHSLLGNVLERGLGAVLATAAFKDLGARCVDTNAKCRDCELRYLCGGACRAWGGEAAQFDLDAPPPECAGLKIRAERLRQAAMRCLEREA